MRVKCLQTIFSAIFFVFVSLPAYSEVVIEPDANSHYSDKRRQATQEYEQGNYLKAKEYFGQVLELALQQGRPTSAVYYNLGSVSYKLGLYEKSKSYFLQLIDHEKLKAIAFYNLALIENKLSEKKAAIDYLHKSKSASTDNQLSRLIDQQLFKLSSSKPDRNQKIIKRDWHAYLYLSPGYDSNVNFAPLEVASNESGNFLQGIGIFDKKIAGDGHGVKKSALLITSTIFMSNYYSTDFNDYNLFDIGLRYLRPVNKWRNAFEFNLKRSTYGHRDYQQTYAATFKTRRTFLNRDTLSLRYRYEQIESLSTIFDYLEGNRQRLRAGYQFKWPEDSVRLWYELEFNNRNNTLRSNYSPTRNTFNLRYEKIIDKKNSVYVEVARRYSDYEPTPTQDREDRRSSFLLSYINRLTPDWRLETRWGFRSNRSTESVFSHDRHIILMTLRLTL